MAPQRHTSSSPSRGPSRVPESNSPDPVSASTGASTSTSARHGIKKRVAHSRRPGQGADPDQNPEPEKMDDIPVAERAPVLVDGGSDDLDTTSPGSSGRRSQWIVLALASGACAAFNGVFAKLTTTELTSTLSQAIARFFGLSAAESVIELIVRCTFFGLNLAFNGIMWTLFTQALARGNSTTQVSIMNTSSNFVITAVLGFAVFSESLPPLWWLGAAMLVAGNVIIGQKDESSKSEVDVVAAADDNYDDDGSLSDSSAAEYGLGTYQPVPVADELLATNLEKDDAVDEDVLDLGRIKDL